MKRLTDTDALIEKCGEWYVEEGPEDGFIGTIKQLLESQPIVHVSEKDADTISRQAAIEDVGDGVYTGSKIRRWLKSLPSVQPNHCAEVGKKVLIDRQEALEKIRTMQTYKLFAGDDMLLIDQAEAQTELMMLPSAQSEHKTGRWITDDSELGIKCNKCGKSFSDYVNAGTGYMFLEEIPNFCPNCGEDIRGEG